jgi:phosphate transport system permease protein
MKDSLSPSAGELPPANVPPAAAAGGPAARRPREKKARRTVLLADRIADRVITVGGILVIVAVLGILVFLVKETLPLFRSGQMTGERRYTLPEAAGHTLGLGLDEYKTLAYALSADGRLQVFHARSGRLLTSGLLDLGPAPVTAQAHTIDRTQWAFGFADGTVRFADARFDTTILAPQDLPTGLTPLGDGDATDGQAVYSAIPGDQYRQVTFRLDLEAPVAVGDAQRAIAAMAYTASGQAERSVRTLATVDGDGQVALIQTASRTNLMTGERHTTVNRIHLPQLPSPIEVFGVRLTAKADTLLVAGRSGVVFRYNLTDRQNPVLAESAQILPPSAELTAFDFLLGSRSLLVAGSNGTLAIYFLLERNDFRTVDGQSLVQTRTFAADGPAVHFFAPSLRDKSFATIDNNGRLEVRHGTSRKQLADFPTGLPLEGFRELVLAPRVDGVMALQADGRVAFYEFDVPHPETTFATLFRKIWYEGYPEPGYTWQSSAATDDYEAKLSLVPLIFGSFKAAFYSMLFAVPIAVLGAAYTSEFVHHRLRGVIKPTMEMMASLPSVVLGFVAALVLAPVVETWIAAVLLAFVSLPLALMLGAYLWQLLPLHLANRLKGIPKLVLMLLTVLLAAAATYSLGPLFEGLFFHGDFRGWLNGDVGGAAPFLFLLLLPLCALAVSLLQGRFLPGTWQRLTGGPEALPRALGELGLWLLRAALTLLLAGGLAHLLALMGVDARGGLVDTYVQRNTLVVGFAMGFAVIPIIYTIAEDALNAVPEHLRAASLGCGATPWQTALYVVLPTAASGVFSAIMIGMGRAVGETMIVVMAAGNTPILDWNIFNGLRALSATIAVELPEAVKNGTLYRVLFLSGLVLFAMTFVINTVAEIVRQRFRKRATQL